MFKFVDGTVQPSEKIEGFCYYNKVGVVESVNFIQDVLQIVDSEQNVINIYREDAPKLILALQAAYEYKQLEEKV